MEVNEARLIALLGKQDEKAFEDVFKTHYRSLHAYAFTLLKDEVMAEEMVQTIFYKLWERSENITISGSIAAYLYRAVHNECLNYLKHLKVRSDHQLHVSHRAGQDSDSASKRLHLKELDERLRKALNDLPEQCRTIFQMSRFEELRYREIAERLDISVKTVENQMGKALKILRSKLVDFLVLFLLVARLALPAVSPPAEAFIPETEIDPSNPHTKKLTLA
jgi:RNA polymerase sigma-70 factor (ECF subfamily)